MTWHPLATNPLPEPREGRTLLIRLELDRHPLTFICPRETALWYGDADAQLPEAMRAAYLQRWPWAEWHLIPAPGEPSEAAAAIADLDEWASPATTGMGSGLHAEKWPALSPSARKLLQEIVGRLKR